MAGYQDSIGREEVAHDQLTQPLLGCFRATLGEYSGLPDDILPPAAHWCLCLPDAPMDALANDGHAKTGGLIPPIALPRRMWAGSQLSFLSAIRSGSKIKRVSSVTSITQKEGRTGTLVFVDLEHQIYANDVLSLRDQQTIVYRDGASEAMLLPESGGADLSAWPVHRVITPDAALLFRYSALTFNAHRIHYDVPYVREEEGYPALIVHGPLMASLLLRLAHDEVGAPNIRNFSFKAKSPAFVDQPLHLVARRTDQGLEMAALGGDGRTVMSAELQTV